MGENLNKMTANEERKSEDSELALSGRRQWVKPTVECLSLSNALTAATHGAMQDGAVSYQS